MKSVSRDKTRMIGRKALLAGAAVTLVFLFAQTAMAATKKEAALEKRVQHLENELREIKALLKKRPPATFSSHTPERMIRSGKKGVTLTISGQVNRGVLIANDGDDTNVFHVDNDHSSTRVRFVGEGKLNENFKVGTVIEVQIESNSTATVNQLADRGIGAGGFTERIIEAYLDHKRWGRLTLGQGKTATDDTSQVDLSGTTVVSKSKAEDFAGGLLFRRKDFPAGVGITAVSLASPSIGRAFDNFDGLSRDDRIRYDTPKIMGFKFSMAHIADSRYDAALTYSAKFGPVKLAAAFGAAHVPDAFNQYSGSISVLHESGVNVTFAAAAQALHATSARGNPDSWYVKIGYLFSPFRIGKTALAVDYFEGSDILAGGDFSQGYGGFVVQNIDKVATELYFGVRNYAYDQNGANFEDILAVLMGIRVKF